MGLENFYNYNQSYPKPKPRYRGWIWLVATVALLGVAGSFVFAVYGEVSRRNQEIQAIINQTQKSDSVLDNAMIDQLKEQMGTTTEVVATTTIFTSDKSQTRQLIEKMDRPHLGNVSSSIVIVEFADFECSVCLEEYPIFRTLTNKYAQDVLFIFRNYPVKSDNSGMMAQATSCANEQGKFWQLHDKFFMNAGKMSTSDDLKQVILSAGLNWSKMQTCMSTEKYRNMVLEDMSDALDLGVRGTPTFFINGSKLEGAVTLETWDRIISKAKELN